MRLFVFFIIFISFLNISFADSSKKEKLAGFCTKVNAKFKAFGWGKIVCNPERWMYDDLSHNGEPLVYQEFFQNPKNQSVTLIFCTIHGDEYTSPYLCVRLVRDILFDKVASYKDVNVVVAPFVNPDGFLLKKPSRLNAKGVDPNRNFPTKDWEKEALQSWKTVYKKDPRRFPGNKPGTEPEVLFQMKLIEKYKPEKILAIHAPYAFLDYDVSTDKDSALIRSEVKELARTMSKKSKNFRVVDYHVFPGSLGNYAGIERGIPTFTLELAKAESHWGEAYWNRFSEAFLYLLHSSIKK